MGEGEDGEPFFIFYLTPTAVVKLVTNVKPVLLISCRTTYNNIWAHSALASIEIGETSCTSVLLESVAYSIPCRVITFFYAPSLVHVNARTHRGGAGAR